MSKKSSDKQAEDALKAEILESMRPKDVPPEDEMIEVVLANKPWHAEGETVMIGSPFGFSMVRGVPMRLHPNDAHRLVYKVADAEYVHKEDAELAPDADTLRAMFQNQSQKRRNG